MKILIHALILLLSDGFNCWHSPCGFQHNLSYYTVLNSVRRGVLTDFKYYEPSKYSKVGFKCTNDELASEQIKNTTPTSIESLILSKDDPSYQQQVQDKKYYLIDSFKQGIINCPSFSSDYIQIASINRVHGLKGHVRATSFGYLKDEQVLKSKYLFLQFTEENEFPLELEYGKLLKRDTYLLKFKGIDSVTSASRLIGAKISVPTDNISIPDDNIYFIQDLIGMDVFLYSDATKTCLGKIIDCVSRHDIAISHSLESITDDLLELELNVGLSLSQLNKLLSESNAIDNLSAENDDVPVTLMDEKELKDADNIYESVEQGAAYVKIYKCSECSQTFTTNARAQSHACGKDAENDSELDLDLEKSENSDAVKVIPLDQMIKESTPVKRVYVPLDKNKTVRVIDVPTNSAYIDTLTVFLAENS